MPDLFHTVTLPASPAAPRTLAWPPQDPATRRTLALDCTRWLDDGARTIAIADLVADAALAVSAQACDGKVVHVRVTGGRPGTHPVLLFVLTLDNGDVERVVVTLPIVALDVPAAPPPPILFAGQALTFGGQPLTFGA